MGVPRGGRCGAEVGHEPTRASANMPFGNRGSAGQGRRIWRGEDGGGLTMIPVQTIELPLTGRENDDPPSVTARLATVGGRTGSTHRSRPSKYSI